MHTFSVYVYGNGDLFREYFNAIVAALGKGAGASNFSSLLHISILLAGVTVIFSFIIRRDLMQMVNWLGLFYFVVYVLFLPEASIIIIDRVNSDAKYAVDHVPLGLALVASHTSSIGDSLTQNIDSNFSMPDEIRYRKSGMVFASRLVETASQFEITDPTFDANLKSFIHQCVFYDLLLNKYSMERLTTSPNVWALISNAASPARSFLYNREVTTCKTGAQSLSEDWKVAIDSAAMSYGKRIYPSIAKEKAQELFLTNLPLSYKYLINISSSASEIMQQNLMSNAIQRGVVSMNANLNTSAALESYAFTRAQEQKRLTNQTMGDMAAHWLPLMRNAFEAIMYGSFIFIVLLSVFPFGITVFKNYIYSLLWLQMWAPLYAIINLIISYYAATASTAATDIDNGLSINSISGLLQINSDLAGLAGYLTLSVPFLSAGIVKGMVSTFTQLSQFVGGVTQSSGTAAAQEAVTGNVSFGNSSLDNHNANNISANHMDTSGRMSAGSFTTQMSGGSSLTVTADGSGVMDMRGALSNLGTTINYADALRSSYGHQAEVAYSAAHSDALAYSASSNAAMRDVIELSKHSAKSSAGGEGWNISSNTSSSEAMNNIHRITQDFAQRHHLSYSESANVLANASLSGQASVSAGIGGKSLPISLNGTASAGMSRTAGHSNSTESGGLFSEAQSFVKDQHFSDHVDIVKRAMSEQSFRTNSEEGNRLLNSASASFDKAESHRHDLQTHLSEANTAREMASLVQDNAQSINVNDNQGFTEWLVNQPGTNGTGRLGYRGAERLKTSSEEMMHYAKQYAEQHQSMLPSKWDHNLASSESAIKNRFDGYQNELPKEASIDARNVSQQHQIQDRASQHGLTSNQVIDKKAVDDVNDQFRKDHAEIRQGKRTIAYQADTQKSKVNDERAHTRHGNLIHDMAHNVDTKDRA